jgi:hypothetical protein
MIEQPVAELPTRNFSPMEQPLPIRENCLSDRDEPKLVKSKSDTLPPTLLVDRMLNADPRGT